MGGSNYWGNTHREGQIIGVIPIGVIPIGRVKLFGRVKLLGNTHRDREGQIIG